MNYINNIINNKFKIIKKIGEGSFGIVFKGENINTKEGVAIKLELEKSKVLNNEAKILKYLSSLSCVPKIKWFGAFQQHRFIVMQLLGISLLEYMDINKQTTLYKCIEIFEKLINIIDDIHSKGIVYKDIKPENFMFDLNNSNIYIIDFGLATSYIGNNNQHIEENMDGHYTGTIRYSSIFIHKGYNHSRRDDLIAIGYMMLYLYNGNLPWMGLEEQDLKKRYNLIQIIKEKELENNIFSQYFKDLYSLQFKEKPNYNKLIINIKNIKLIPRFSRNI